MRLKKGFLVVAAALALIAAGCGDDDDTASTGGDTDSGDEAGTYTVGIDAGGDEINTTVFAYFPDTVKAHPGDTITYDSRFSGEPHSITFGKSISEAIKIVESVPEEVLNSDGPPPPEYADDFEKVDKIFSALPSMLPEGPGDANQVSVNPCFITTGSIPTDATKPCEVQEPAPFTGTEVFYNSGFLPDGETFDVVLADDIAPGEYVGFCILHFTEMTSTIEVVAEGTDVPDADAVEAAGQEQLDEITTALETAVAAAEGAAKPGEVQSGVPMEDGPAFAAQFVPNDLEVKSGETVTWNLVGPHTVSFNAPESARTLIAEGDDGNFHLSEEALAPAGFEPPPPPTEEPEGPPPAVEGGTYSGEGFFSSGILFDQPFKLAFAKAGSYEYVCLIHPEMEGTITVS